MYFKLILYLSVFAAASKLKTKPTREEHNDFIYLLFNRTSIVRNDQREVIVVSYRAKLESRIAEPSDTRDRVLDDGDDR